MAQATDVWQLQPVPTGNHSAATSIRVSANSCSVLPPDPRFASERRPGSAAQRARVLAATAISSTQPSTLIRVESMMRS